MKIACLASLLLSFLSTTVCAQEQAPKILREAAQCLAAKKHIWQDWLDLETSKATALSFGYVLDAKSYPGEKVLYVVEYLGPGRSEGFVFAVFLTQNGTHRIFNIQNNAKFVRSKDGIEFVEPPLGDTWTQERLVAAIERIQRQPRFKLRVKDLLPPSDLTQCESYTDRR
jgi:hypothetical protein